MGTMMITALALTVWLLGIIFTLAFFARIEMVEKSPGNAFLLALIWPALLSVLMVVQAKGLAEMLNGEDE